MTNNALDDLKSYFSDIRDITRLRLPARPISKFTKTPKYDYLNKGTSNFLVKEKREHPIDYNNTSDSWEM